VKTLRDEKAAQQEVEKMIKFFKSSEFDDSEFGQLLDLYTLDRINLLFLGRIGAGKSNFISTLASIFKGKLDRTKAHYANSNKSVTQEYKRITIPEISDKICFMDIFGINENYDDLIDPLLEGKIPEGFSETEIKKEGINEEVLQEKTLDSQIHAVLIIFEPGTLMSEEEITKLKKIFERIRGKNFQSI
jgi:septin family protein